MINDHNDIHVYKFKKNADFKKLKAVFTLK